MKTHLTIIAIYFCIINSINAQWNEQVSGTTNRLASIYFTDTNNGFVAGLKDTILKTTNGGVNWIPQITGTLKRINSIYFTNSTLGYAVGDSGLILKTTDGGNLWSLQNSGTITSLHSVYFPTTDTGYAVGNGFDTTTNPTTYFGIILKTINGGNSWNIIYNNDTLHTIFPHIFFVNSNIGYLTTQVNILKTTDGGISWNTLPYSGVYNPFAIFFINADTGFVGGNGYSGSISKTTDGGNTWSQPINTQPGITSIFFVNENIGYAVGGYGGDPIGFPTAVIYKTNDGGNTWINQYLGSGELFSVFFTDINNGYAVGLNGMILKTTNGGTTWIYNNDNIQNEDVNVFPNPTTGIFTVKVPQETKTIRVLNTIGQVIEVKKIENKFETTFNLSKSGLYFVQVTTNNGIGIQKVIVCP